MLPSPVPADPGRDEDLAWLDRDPMTTQEREELLDRICEHDEPPGPEEYEDFEPFTADELAEIREAATDELLAVTAATTGRRGPGQPGSARVFPGESCSPAASFGPGMALEVLPGCAQLAVAADAAAGEDDAFAGVSEAELIGVLCAWDRVEAHAAARKLAAIDTPPPAADARAPRSCTDGPRRPTGAAAPGRDPASRPASAALRASAPPRRYLRTVLRATPCALAMARMDLP